MRSREERLKKSKSIYIFTSRLRVCASSVFRIGARQLFPIPPAGVDRVQDGRSARPPSDELNLRTRSTIWATQLFRSQVVDLTLHKWDMAPLARTISAAASSRVRLGPCAIPYCRSGTESPCTGRTLDFLVGSAPDRARRSADAPPRQQRPRRFPRSRTPGCRCRFSSSFPPLLF